MNDEGVGEKGSDWRIGSSYNNRPSGGKSFARGYFVF
jgi:hypothetical protein